MKRTLALFLALLLVVSLAACGGGGKSVELSTSNIKDYLAFDFDYAKVERKTQIGISFGYTDLTMRTYAVKSGSFSDAEVTVQIPLTNGWSVSSSDKAYVKDDSETLTITFRVPANGDFSETHDLIASMIYSDPDSTNVRYTITDVSGTFTPN